MKKIINNIRVFDGVKLTTPTNVVIEDGYISNIGGLLMVIRQRIFPSAATSSVCG